MASVRRLTAILAADVAGYSRLMGADEEGTHERLQAHLRELVNPKASEQRGRIVKNTGDGLLADCGDQVPLHLVEQPPAQFVLLEQVAEATHRLGESHGGISPPRARRTGNPVRTARQPSDTARVPALRPHGVCAERL